ncbi:hypothetical protein EDC01DRAFT_730638 [Geopyxis carbonaria]|nr:hypothetical protein EDC01DRAFT_730638 [Geopyxis carbonaria]
MMLGPTDETIIIWLMLGMNLLFLLSRLFLRRRQWSGFQLSDLLIIIAFLLILVESVVITVVNVQERNFMSWMAANPQRQFLPLSEQDPIRNYIWYDKPGNIRYLKFCYALLIFNVLAIWFSKFTLLVFFYEVFPSARVSPVLRRFLHAATFVTVATFATNLLETLLWCRPYRNLWNPLSMTDYCSPKTNPTFISAQFATHLLSTLVLAALPLILLFMHSSRSERAFAVTVLAFSALSIAAAATAFVMLRRLGGYTGTRPVPAAPRHAATIATVADQNAFFLAACLSVVRVSVVRKRTSKGVVDAGGVSADDIKLGGGRTRGDIVDANAEVSTGCDRRTSKGMQIQVEKTWCVDVEIVGDLGREGARRAQGKEGWGWPTGSGAGWD